MKLKFLIAVNFAVFFVPTVFANQERFEACRAKLKQAHRLEVLHGLEWHLPREPKVTAGPTFYKIPIDAKEGFAETVNCFLTVGKSNFVSFDILDWQTGKKIARFNYGKLTVN